MNEHCGSKTFMAPEMFAPGDIDTYKADAWSLGVMLYVLATGRISWANKDSMGENTGGTMDERNYEREFLYS